MPTRPPYWLELLQEVSRTIKMFVRSQMLSVFVLSFFCCLHFSGVGDGHQSSGADPNKAAGRETVVQASDGLHPLGRADRRLAFSVVWLWADAPARRALLSHVLVQLREGQSLAV